MDPKNNKSETLDQKESSIDAALNRKGFAEFVALHANHEDILEDEERAEEVLKVFEKKDALMEFSRKMLSEQIGKEIGTGRGLELSKEELGGVDDFLSKMAIEDSEGFLNLAAKADKFNNDTKEIDELKGRLEALGVNVNEGVETDAIGSNAESLKDKMSVLQGVKGTDYTSSSTKTLSKWIGVRSVFLDKNLESNRAAAGEQYGIEKTWYGKFKDLDKQIEITQGLMELQQMRKSLIKDVFPRNVLEPVIQAKVSKYLSDMSLATQLEKLEQAQEFLEKARLASEKGDTMTDYLGAVNDDETQKTIDVAMEKAVALKVNEAIGRSTLGDKALARLEKSLMDFIKREDLGSKDKDEYKDFLVKTLEEQVAALTADHESKAKAVLIKRVIIKINNA